MLNWTVDGKQIDVGPGQALCIPRAAIHRFDNNGNQDAKALCVITPAAIGPQYFRDSAEVINAAAGGSAGPSLDGGDDAPLRSHACSISGPGVYHGDVSEQFNASDLGLWLDDGHRRS